jgi:hypothetical protein
MAESKDNYVTKGLVGTIGKTLTYRQRAGKTFVSKFPRPTTIPPTQKLRSVRANFADCIAYAKAAINDPILKAKYQAEAVGGQTAFNVATSDALNRPELINIKKNIHQESPAAGIIAPSKDDLKEATIAVSIHRSTGELLEQGNASVQPGTNDWIFRPANAIPAGSMISLVTWDLPKNGLSLSIVLT